jgi:hypothetical protein
MVRELREPDRKDDSLFQTSNHTTPSIPPLKKTPKLRTPPQPPQRLNIILQRNLHAPPIAAPRRPNEASPIRPAMRLADRAPVGLAAAERGAEVDVVELGAVHAHDQHVRARPAVDVPG